MAKTQTTKHGVRDLNDYQAARHVHRYVPNTFVAKGKHVTQMRCYCGDISAETEAE